MVYTGHVIPSIFEGLELWYDIADLRTLGFRSGSNKFLETLYDKSGNNRHVTQITPAYQPELGVNQLNNIDLLNFNQANENEMIYDPGLHLLGDMTIIAVTDNWETPGNAVSPLIAMSEIGTDQNKNMQWSVFLEGASSLPGTRWEYGPGTPQITFSTFSQSGNPMVAIWTRDSVAKTMTYKINGASEVVGYSNNPDGGANSKLMLGTYIEGPGIDGTLDFAEVMIFNRKLPAAVLTQLETAQKVKWGVSY